MRPEALTLSTCLLTGLCGLMSLTAQAQPIPPLAALLSTQIAPNPSVSGIRGRAALDSDQNVLAYIENMERLLGETLSPDSATPATGTQLLILQDHARAVRSLELEIARVERQEGLFSDALIEPLVMLGLAQHALGDSRRSADSFARAQHITHRQEGVLNPRQIPLILFRTLNLMAGGQRWQAEQLQRTAHRINRHHFGITHPRTLLSATRLGTWLTLMGRYKPALTLYRQHLIDLQEHHQGPHPAMAPLMRGMAITFLHEGLTTDRGITMLEQLVLLHEAFPTEFLADERFQTHTFLADLLMKNARENEAVKHYLAAWQHAAETEKLRQATRLRVVRGPFRWVTHEQDDALFFEFRFRIRADGRPQYIKLMNTNASASQSVAAIKLFRQSRFLPRIIDGDATSVPSGVHRFTLDVSDSIQDQLILPVIDQLTRALTDSAQW